MKIIRIFSLAIVVVVNWWGGEWQREREKEDCGTKKNVAHMCAWCARATANRRPAAAVETRLTRIREKNAHAGRDRRVRLVSAARAYGNLCPSCSPPRPNLLALCARARVAHFLSFSLHNFRRRRRWWGETTTVYQLQYGILILNNFGMSEKNAGS